MLREETGKTSISSNAEYLLRASELAGVPLLHDAYCGPGLRRLYTRGYAPSSTSSASRSLSTRRFVCHVSLSSSSKSDRTGQPVGDRPGQPSEHKSSEAQIRTLLDEQKQKVLAERQARISQHEFEAAQAEEKQRLLQGLL